MLHFCHCKVPLRLINSSVTYIWKITHFLKGSSQSKTKQQYILSYNALHKRSLKTSVNGIYQYFCRTIVGMPLKFNAVHFSYSLVSETRIFTTRGRTMSNLRIPFVRTQPACHHLFTNVCTKSRVGNASSKTMHITIASQTDSAWAYIKQKWKRIFNATFSELSSRVAPYH